MLGKFFLSKETTRWQGVGLEPWTFSSEVQRANHYAPTVGVEAGGWIFSGTVYCSEHLPDTYLWLFSPFTDRL